MKQIRIGFEFEFVHWETSRFILKNRLARYVGLDFSQPFTELKTDVTIECQADLCGHELVTPPLPFNESIDLLHRIFEWMEYYGCTTNDTTGFHVGMSIDGVDLRKNLDRFKLNLLVDEMKLLSDFNRQNNEWCNSGLNMYRHNYRLSGNLDRDSENFEHWCKNHSPKEVAVNFGTIDRNNYVEFRGMGGRDYHEKGQLIERWIRHLIRAMLLSVHEGKGNRILNRKYNNFRNKFLIAV
jgi:hypothetical protein